MGCFSFLCKESGKPALSTSFDGSPCYLFLLKDGVVIEEMYGNYDSYGRVFNGNGGSFEWSLDWGDVCDLMFSDSEGDGFALVLEEHFTGTAPNTRSEDDPNQGWGGFEGDDECLLADFSSDKFKKVTKPYHKVYN